MLVVDDGRRRLFVCQSSWIGCSLFRFRQACRTSLTRSIGKARWRESHVMERFSFFDYRLGLSFNIASPARHPPSVYLTFDLLIVS